MNDNNFPATMRVKFIKASDTYPLRLKVLRPGGIEEDCHFANDRLEGAFHLGVHKGDALISVASFYPEKQGTLNGWKQYRLRGMATDPDHQGHGAGKRSLTFAIEHIKAQQADLIWCNARLIAVPFYERMGFEIKGELFDIPGIGPHYLMVRKV